MACPTRKAAAAQLTRMFLFQANRQADQSHELAPKPPEGFPPHMMTYDQWLSERGMHPRDVDRLTRDELFWLPVIQAAKQDAAAQLRPEDD
jgi:hypothetical protein